MSDCSLKPPSQIASLDAAEIRGHVHSYPPALHHTPLII